MEWLTRQYNKFHTYFFTNVTPLVRGAVFITLVGLALFCILNAIKGKSDIVIKKWLPFFFAIVLIVFACLYMYYTR